MNENLNSLMKVSVSIAQKQYWLKSQSATSLAIALQFNGAQPNCFGVERARADAMQAGGFVGDVTRGGSCNVMDLKLNPHCNGTHTESISHIVTALLPSWRQPPLLMPATLLSLTPQAASTQTDNYCPAFQHDDYVIHSQQLQSALEQIDAIWLQALVIRTLPNDPEKMSRSWQSAPFFTPAAMRYLCARGVLHLLVDFPSVDRMNDEGHLSAHHAWWQVPADTHEHTQDSRLHATISEMIYVPNELPDGHYVLNLQIPAFELDVAPSRPVLIPVEPV